MNPLFWWALWLTSLPWVATPIVLAIYFTARPKSPDTAYSSFEFTVQVGSGLLFIYGFPVFALAGLIALIFHRQLGAGILAGTGVGLAAGFVTCLAAA